MSWLKRMWQTFEQTVSPKHFYRISGAFIPWLAIISALLISLGTVWGLAFAPPDYYQGNSYRIIFIHVPSASLAMSAYFALAICGVISLVWKIKTAEMVARAIAGLGAVFCFLALVTGGVWGKPTWGTYWVWDARLTSMLILLFLYLGVIALYNAYESSATGAKAAAILSIVGVINLPIIKYSVVWWNTLHQGATFTLTAKPKMPAEMWMPLLVMMFGFYCLFALLTLLKTRNIILQRERRSQWVKELVQQHTEQKHGL
ncbi:heme ABC transporter permease [Agitococcus lubricus]|uniref:Heme exporter protein C n=1 Tax=Agitococcus lubricus TaxID=1077255 RepID=A0A2T5IZN6_9GAMM|nr:heme ABC transporter permease [Agitococcus lubricus]PTQ89411.1 heme exporter protein C [Agitococcus lubricus]